MSLLIFVHYPNDGQVRNILHGYARSLILRICVCVGGIPHFIDFADSPSKHRLHHHQYLELCLLLRSLLHRHNGYQQQLPRFGVRGVTMLPKLRFQCFVKLQ